jgi:Leucine-rich repeat (LRR) protein
MKKYFIITFLLCLALISKGQYAVNITRSDSATFAFYTSLLNRLTEPENVEVLYLNDSKLEELPKNIGKFNNITSLYLGDNKLYDLPHQLYYLHKLETLDLRNNELEEISSEIGHLKNLKRLDLRGNNISCMPDQIKHLKSLKWLYLGPAEIFDEDEKVHIRKLLPNTIVFFEKTSPTQNPSREINFALFQEDYLAPNNTIYSNRKIVTITEPIKVYYQDIISCKR